jgi:uncharacterized protein (TIGR02466 family)
MDINDIFPTPIGFLNNKDLTDKILPIVTTILDEIDDRGHFHYKTSYNMSQVESYLSNFPFIKQSIIEIAQNYTTKIGYQLPDKIDISLFTSRMIIGDRHESHIHPDSILSGLFYLNIDKNSAPILFEDPRPIRPFNQLIPIDKNRLEKYNTYEISFMPKVGDIIIWESWLKHRVPLNNSNYRETLVFNIHKQY